VVVLGDSYASGEAGRWAGSSDVSTSYADALGPTAYFDNATNSAETIPGCHRSKNAEIHIGGGVNSANLACSGARTYTQAGSPFKPGIDFYTSGGNKGQALALQEFAMTHHVKMVVLSIGGNNFGFADVVQSCVTDFLLSPSWWPNYCSDDGSVRNYFGAANTATQTNAIAGAIDNVRRAMSNAGYASSQYSIVMQNYPSPLPRGSGIRYSQSGFTRQSTGGCGFWNRDADWAEDVALPTINGAVRSAATSRGVAVLDISAAFNGRRLCESGVNLMETTGLGNWTNPNAVDATEWINQIRTISTLFGPYQIQESFHPNTWGELALRNCVRQAYNGGSPRGGTCTHGTGLDAAREPNMTLS
jgi:GDSL-like Lipase/Acylhydrolase family